MVIWKIRLTREHGEVQMQSVEDVWINYWKSRSDLFSKYSRSTPSLLSYQRPVYNEIRKLILEEDLKSSIILNAGSGVDLISLKLKKEFPDLRIYLLDVSLEALSINEHIFGHHNAKAECILANIFKCPCKEGRFDIIFNTGLLEHFGKEEQKLIFQQIIEALKPGGYFVTANPSERGVIYKFCMKHSIRNRSWPFGRENPIASLNFLVSDKIMLREYHSDFISQLYFLKLYNWALWFIVLPFSLAGKLPFVSGLFDAIFGRCFGTYLVISVFKKNL